MSPLVYNAFIFFNELPQLEIRLNELDSVVDYFILSESTFTHSGKPKPLFYEEHKYEERFKKFEHKIIHQIITDTPQDYLNLKNDTNDELYNIVVNKVNKADWFQKDRPDYCRITWESECLLRAMKNCKSDDILILDEADEIPRWEAIRYIIQTFDPSQIYNFEVKYYYYYLNCLNVAECYGSTVLTFEKFKELSLCEMRVRRRGLIVKDAGFHFSYMLGPEAVKYKIESHAEQTLNTDAVKNSIEDNIKNCLTVGKDIYFRPATFKKVEIDETYPKYIYENQDKFAEYIMK
jgi:beta-1,4-mannosyl-glycoprotein beta-1,4-N-acetylglucosaminyltransferase